MISITIGAAGLAAAGFYRLLSPLVGETTAAASEALSERSRAVLTREKTLALRAFARPSGTFDPSRPIPRTLSKNEPLIALTFPHAYRIGGGTGTVDFTDWLFVAWFSQRDRDDIHDEVGGLDPGDVFCAVPFRVAHARSSSDAAPPNVDCTIAEVVPARR